jgi:hypothetical protein
MKGGGDNKTWSLENKGDGGRREREIILKKKNALIQQQTKHSSFLSLFLLLY